MLGFKFECMIWYLLNFLVFKYDIKFGFMFVLDVDLNFVYIFWICDLFFFKIYFNFILLDGRYIN